MRKYLLAATMSLSLVTFGAAAQANEVSQLASAHCRSLAAGAADMTFVIASAPLTTPANIQRFNQLFSAYIIKKYNLNVSAAGSCPLELVSNTATPIQSAVDYVAPASDNIGGQGVRETATIRTALVSKSAVPVVLGYKLAREGQGQWYIANLSLNGKPLVGGYEKIFTDIIKKDGFPGLLKKLETM